MLVAVVVSVVVIVDTAVTDAVVVAVVVSVDVGVTDAVLVAVLVCVASQARQRAGQLRRIASANGPSSSGLHETKRLGSQNISSRRPLQIGLVVVVVVDEVFEVVVKDTVVVVAVVK